MPEGVGLLDVMAAILAAVFMIYGAARGIIRLTLGFLALALGWIVAVRFGETLALRLGAEASSRPGATDLLRLVAFGLIFLGVVAAMTVVAWLMVRFLGAVNLRGFDRLAGAGLGLLMAIILTCAATVPLLAFSPPDGGGLFEGSLIAPYAIAGGDYLKLVAAEPLQSRFTRFSRALFDEGPRTSTQDRDRDRPDEDQ